MRVISASRRLFSRAWPAGKISTRSVALAATALVTVGLLPATSHADITSTQTTFLAALGPISADDGFPTWFEDSNGIRLQHCLDNTSMCGAAEAPLPDPTKPVSFPNNYPEESFFYQATVSVTLPSGGNALFVAAVEAGFSGAEPAVGAQHMLGRIRLRIDTPAAGHYTVTHPYGVDEFDVTASGDRSINYTDDVGVATGVYDGVLDSRVDPFLTWDTGLVTGPDGGLYIGDPGVDHAVTGSTFGTNFFRIDGPDIGGPGINTFSTNLFSLVGKVATNSGVDPGHPVYSRVDTSGGFVDVAASTDPNKSVHATLPGSSAISLRGGPDGHYVARLAFTGTTPPTKVNVTNSSDSPPASFNMPVTDLVTATEATYDADQKTLTVSAASSDQAVPPTLTVTGFGNLVPATQTISPAHRPNATTFTGSAAAAAASLPQAPPTLAGTVTVGTATFENVEAPPQSVEVTSSAGGRDVEQVRMTGAAFPSDPVTADAGPDQQVQQGQQVLLDGSASLNATSMAWTQLSGPAVTLTGADTPIATFTAPSTVATLTFQLVAQGPQGPSSDDIVVNVLPVTAPVANAGPDQTALVSDLVVLDGTASTGAATFAWTQISGPTVTMAAADTAHPTFTMPASLSPLVFVLTVTGPGGSATDDVAITATPDVLAITRAEFRPDKAEWRIEGTSSILNNNAVSVFLGNGTSGPLIGTGLVDTTGAWVVRVRNSPVAAVGSTVTVQSSRGGLLIGVPFVFH